jgi:hypothetical protein
MWRRVIALSLAMLMGAWSERTHFTPISPASAKASWESTTQLGYGRNYASRVQKKARERRQSHYRRQVTEGTSASKRKQNQVARPYSVFKRCCTQVPGGIELSTFKYIKPDAESRLMCTEIPQDCCSSSNSESGVSSQDVAACLDRLQYQHLPQYTHFQTNFGSVHVLDWHIKNDGLLDYGKEYQKKEYQKELDRPQFVSEQRRKFQERLPLLKMLIGKDREEREDIRWYK